MAVNHVPAAQFLRSILTGLVLASAFVLTASSLRAQELIYKEDFNTDGEAAGRYTTTGHDVFEVARIRSELNNADQKGPIYWARNTEVSFVGIPNIPGRRMILTWRPGTDPAAVTEDMLKLFDSSVNWLLEGKKAAKVAVSPNAAAIGVLADRLTAAGHTIEEDDPAILNDADIKADLYFHGPGGGNASRYALLPKPVIVISSGDLDDMVVGSIGTALTFEPGQVNIATPTHPAAGGKTASFNAFTGSQPFEGVGRFLPVNATTLATVNHTVPPAVTRLDDVDQIVEGTKQNSKTAGKVTEIDFADGSAGSWANDNAVPGGYTGNWGLQLKGKLSVAKAGTYRMATGSDDGVRFQIDRDKNGFTAADNVVEDFGPHGYTLVYQNVTFATAGTYDFEARAYNSGGGGSLEISVAVQEGAISDDALDSGFWEVLGISGSSPVKLAAAADVTAFIAAGANTVVREPLIVLLNGPNETPPGFFYGGGPFTGFEGTGFYAGSGMNKWPFPDNQTFRTLRLKPVNVAGKKDVRLTVALAGAQIDFEDSDFMDILIYPNGASSAPVTLAHFRGVQNGVQPWLADQKDNYVRRLTREFADFTYNIPATATDLIVEFKVFSSWWNEILALDNVRITSGAISVPSIITFARTATGLKLTFEGTLQSSDKVEGVYADVAGAKSPLDVTFAGAAKFYRSKK